MNDTEKLAQMMIRCGLATGHGDTIDDLIFELEKQIKNTSHAFSDALKKIEQLRLANSDLQMWFDYAKTECDKLQAEVLRLREVLQQIAEEGSGHGKALAYAALKEDE
jgi:peptidoglycan hydrolase CwlO-like protein